MFTLIFNKNFLPSNHYLESLLIEVFWHFTLQRVFNDLTTLSSATNNSRRIFNIFSLFGMNKKNPSVTVRTHVHVVESFIIIKVPFLDALKKFIEFLSSPHC